MERASHGELCLEWSTHGIDSAKADSEDSSSCSVWAASDVSDVQIRM
jgi:hypothetical protein